MIDNLRDIELLEAAAAGARTAVLLRIAPGVSPDTHPAISTGGPNTKFGFDLAHAPAAIERAQASEAIELAGPALAHRLADHRARPLPRGAAGDRALGDFAP